MFTEYFNLCPWRANNWSLKTHLAIQNEPKQSIRTAWQITEVSNSAKRRRRAVKNGNHADLRPLKICCNSIKRLYSFPFQFSPHNTAYKVPLRNMRAAKKGREKFCVQLSQTVGVLLEYFLLYY